MRSRPSVSRGVACLALLAVAVLLFSACGSRRVPPSGKVSPAASQLVARLDRLDVRRTDAFPQNHLRFSFPAQVVVSDPSRAQPNATASTALDLPRRLTDSCFRSITQMFDAPKGVLKAFRQPMSESCATGKQRPVETA